MEQWFNMKKQLDTPILLLVFNRPHVTSIVLNAIREVRPKILFVAQDGARSSVSEDEARIADVRQLIEDGVDWECELHTLYRESNLGCKLAVSGAIDWFFDNNEDGIILEDDCVPDPSFYIFCTELLEKYRHDNRIMHISGNNFNNGVQVGHGSYYFSNINHCWGWATWASAWKHFDVNLTTYKEFKSEKRMQDIFRRERDQLAFTDAIDDILNNKLNSWAYIWNYCCFVQSGLTCRPNVNLVTNIGFTEESTHTDNPNDPLAGVPVESMAFPLIHPEIFLASRKGDDIFMRRNRYYRK